MESGHARGRFSGSAREPRSRVGLCHGSPHGSRTRREPLLPNRSRVQFVDPTDRPDPLIRSSRGADLFTDPLEMFRLRFGPPSGSAHALDPWRVSTSRLRLDVWFTVSVDKSAPELIQRLSQYGKPPSRTRQRHGWSRQAAPRYALASRLRPASPLRVRARFAIPALKLLRDGGAIHGSTDYAARSARSNRDGYRQRDGRGLLQSR